MIAMRSFYPMFNFECCLLNLVYHAVSEFVIDFECSPHQIVTLLLEHGYVPSESSLVEHESSLSKH